MKRRTGIILIAAAISVLALSHTAVPIHAQAPSGSIDMEHYPGPLDWRYIAAYQCRLSLAKGPAMDALRKKIAAGPKDLAREIAATRKLGIATSVAELKLPKWSAAQDALPDYVALGKLTGKESFSDQLYEALEPWDRRHSMTVGEREALKRALAGVGDALRLAHRASEKPHCSLTLALSDEERFRVTSGWHEAASLLRRESLSLALQGRYEAAVRNQALIIKTLSHTGEDPIIIGHAIAGLVLIHIVEGFADILAVSGPDAKVAAAVKQVIGNVQLPSLERALRGELAWSLDQTRALASAPSEKFVEMNLVGAAGDDAFEEAMDALMRGAKKRKPLPPLTAAERKFAMDFLSAVDAATLPVARKRILAANLEHAKRRVIFAKTSVIEADPHDALSEMVAASIQMFGEIDNGDTYRNAMIVVLLTACDVMAHAAREGKFPESLEALGPPPNDPFSGVTLPYRREEKGFVVYSVGPEGDYKGESTRKVPLAAVFRYPPAPPPWLQDLPPLPIMQQPNDSQEDARHD